MMVAAQLPSAQQNATGLGPLGEPSCGGAAGTGKMLKSELLKDGLWGGPCYSIYR